MKVVHVVENLDRGGLERVVIELVLAQRAAGYECEVACLFEQGALAGELLERGVPVHRCGKRMGSDPFALWRLRAYLRRRQGAVLHSHNAVAHYHMVLAALGLDFRRVVNTRHGMGNADPQARGERRYRRSMVRTDYVATVCETVQRSMAAAGVAPRGGLVTVPNGIRMDGLSRATDPARATLVGELGFAPGTQLVGTVGRLDPVKDHDLLLRAFASATCSAGKAGLVIVGEGPSRADLEAAASALGLGELVRFTGHRSDIGHLLAGFSVYAQSSRSEGYSLALLEACVAGLPVVATDVGGNPEIIRQGVNGLLVASGDADALSAALADLLGDPARREAMGQAGREWAMEEASLGTMVARYAALYAGVPAGSAARPAGIRHRPHPPADHVAHGEAALPRGASDGRT